MTWWDVIPGFATAMLVLFGPGLIVAAGWRLKPLVALPLAPLLSLTAIGVSTFPASVFGNGWGAWWVFGCAVLFAALGIFRWLRPLPTEGAPSREQLVVLIPYLVGIVLAAGVLGRRILWAMGNPLTIAQRWDNAFHLNASAYVLLTGNATTMDLGSLAGSGFYPATFHDCVALVASLSHLDVIPATHAVTMVAVLAVWPLSLVILLETFFRTTVIGRFVLGVFALGLNVFPYVLLDWGLVYPNILAVAVLPALIAVAVTTLARGEFSPLARKPAAQLLIPVVVGAGLIHPNAVCLAFAVCFPMLIFDAVSLLIGRVTSIPRAKAVLLGATLILITVCGCWVWVRLSRSLSDSGWEPFETFPQALGESLAGSSMGRPSFPASVLVLVGLLWLIRNWRQNKWWTSCFVVIVSFYVVAASSSSDEFRNYYTGVFYTDNYRTAAFLAVALVPVGVVGVQWLCELIARALEPVTCRMNRIVWAGLKLLCALAIATVLTYLTASSLAFLGRMGEVSEHYSMQKNADILSSDEISLMEQVDDYVDPGATVIVNPWQGGNLVYLLAQRNPSHFYMTGTLSDNVRFINKHLNEAASSPQVCQALANENASYVLDLDSHWIAGTDAQAGISENYSGLLNLDSTPGFTPVLQVGDDVLYRITACD